MPEPFPTDRLCAGQVGYVITGMKTTKNAQIGDTWHGYKQPVEALPGFKPSKSMVFAGALPIFMRVHASLQLSLHFLLGIISSGLEECRISFSRQAALGEDFKKDRNLQD